MKAIFRALGAISARLSWFIDSGSPSCAADTPATARRSCITEDFSWWAKGGQLRGESWRRIGFLRDLIEADVENGLTPITPSDRWEFNRVSGAHDGDVLYLYFGEHQPRAWAVGLPKEDGDYQIDLIDTWEMTVSPLQKASPPVSPGLRQRGGAIVGGAPEAAFGLDLPGKPWQAVRVRRRR